MKIATWNVERLKHRKSLDEIIDTCNRIQADILILTESDDAIQPDYKYCCHTPTPPQLEIKGHDIPITMPHQNIGFQYIPTIRSNVNMKPMINTQHFALNWRQKKAISLCMVL